MIQIENNQVYSTEGKLVHRLSNPKSCFKRSTILPTETIDDFEEVDAYEVPKYTEEEYKQKVQELIAEKYSISDEIALINNLKGDKDEYLIEYDEYMKYRVECKEKAKELLSK